MLKLVKTDLNLIWFDMWTPLHSYGDIFKIGKWYVYNHSNELLLTSIKWKFDIIKSKNLWRLNNIFLLGKFDDSWELDEKWFVHW